MKNLSKVRGMGRLAKLGLVLGGLGVSGVMAAGPSFANTNTGQGTQKYVNGNAAGTSSQMKGTAVAQYKANYTDYYFGLVNCAGAHQVKNGVTQDSFTCTSTSPSGLTNVTPNGQITLANIGGWLSDFDGVSYAKSFTATVSANGMSYTAVATY
jgi:hypothetical protein